MRPIIENTRYVGAVDANPESIEQTMFSPVEIRNNAVEVLKKLPAFQDLLPAEYLKIISHCKSVIFKKDEVLFSEGDVGSSLYVLLSGEISIMMSGRGIVHMLSPGEILGEMSIVRHLPRAASAIATAESILLKLEGEAMDELFTNNPRIGFIVMRNIARTLADRLFVENRK